MHESCEIWNLLHDGSLESLKLDGTDLHLSVGIRYLAEILQPGSQDFLLTLHGCATFEYTDWETETPTTDLSRIQDLEILGTDSESRPAKISTSEGDLLVDFTGFSLKLANGVPCSMEQLRQAAGSYWDEFSSGTKQSSD